ncbi:uncharacterized protein LOC132061188 [Lycium ferocissimum]|uniref:uncharacterized protein LOC132061188 n=1 Tax=Lycium ferocissimum TaxID=112874 RepID=UPI0028169697|nr:uncharacterized protein LOC132061188 [Lycium ferocissimum]
MDQNHPLFLNATDISGILIISFQLTGHENYTYFYRSIRLALLGRNKLSLVDGSALKESFPDELHYQWERVNAIFLSWLMSSISKSLVGGVVFATNAQSVWKDSKERFDRIDGSRTYSLHKEVATLSQGTASIATYYSRMKELWEEFEAMTPASNCNCICYVAMYTKGGGNQKFKKNYNLICEVCKIRGYTKDNCWKVIGYPPDFKFKKRGRRTSSAHNVFAHKVDTVTGNSNPSSSANLTSILMPYCDSKYDKNDDFTVSLLSSDNNKDSTVLLVSDKGKYWIIDTGASNHMFKYNLLLVAKLTKELGWFAFFFPIFCVFQELFSGRGNQLSITSELQKCSVYPCAKQTRNNFPASSIKTVATFDMIHFRKPIKIVRSDNGTEFVNSICDNLFKKLDIVHQRTCPYTPQQNGVPERKHRHILEVTRAIRYQGKVPIKVWGHCVSTAVYLINRMPSLVINNQFLFERLYNMKPSLGHLKVLGSLCYAKVLQEYDKLMSRTKPAVHMGYSETQKAYILYDLSNKYFFVSRDVSFRENMFPFDQESSSTPLFVDQSQDIGILCEEEYHQFIFQQSTVPTQIQETLNYDPPSQDHPDQPQSPTAEIHPIPA